MAMQVALKEDLRSQLRTLQQLRLLLDLFGVDWSNLWLQQQDGSVVRAEHAVDLGLGLARGHAHLLPISCPFPAHLLPISCPSPAHPPVHLLPISGSSAPAYACPPPMVFMALHT